MPTTSAGMTHFTLPDFVERCPLPLYINPHYKPTSLVSEKWLDSYGVHPNEAHRDSFRACNFGLLTAMCYSQADADRFRILCDFINCLFAFDDLTDEGGLRMDTNGTSKASTIVMKVLKDPHASATTFKVGKVIQDFWRRAVELGCSEGTKHRFIEATRLYLESVTRQVQSRTDTTTLDVAHFIKERRDTGAVRMCFAMGEYGVGLDLPDHVFQHPVLRAMEDCANDVVALSNDVYSYNVEQAQGDRCNFIETLMQHKNFTLQQAMDYAGDFICWRMKGFDEKRQELPSWGPQVDAELEKYIRVMCDWMIGGFCWSLESKRYFGEDVEKVKATLRVALLPQEKPRGETVVDGL
ncbi:hypothetical protein FRC03_011633 [Tulasnella sp. 419]|nr:hypothetical protein FRC03_011633 [Tulasnella sp. 419]